MSCDQESAALMKLHSKTFDANEGIPKILTWLTLAPFESVKWLILNRAKLRFEQAGFSVATVGTGPGRVGCTKKRLITCHTGSRGSVGTGSALKNNKSAPLYWISKLADKSGYRVVFIIPTALKTLVWFLENGVNQTPDTEGRYFAIHEKTTPKILR